MSRFGLLARSEGLGMGSASGVGGRENPGPAHLLPGPGSLAAGLVSLVRMWSCSALVLMLAGLLAALAGNGCCCSLDPAGILPPVHQTCQILSSAYQAACVHLPNIYSIQTRAAMYGISCIALMQQT